MPRKKVSQAQAVREAKAAGVTTIQQAKEWVVTNYPTLKGKVNGGSFKTAYYSSEKRAGKKAPGRPRHSVSMNGTPGSLRDQLSSLVQLVGKKEAMDMVTRLLA